MDLDLRIVDLTRELLFTALLVSGPLLLVGLFVGVAVSLFQALTSVQEQTLSMVPKMIAVIIVTLLLLAPALGHPARLHARSVFADSSTASDSELMFPSKSAIGSGFVTGARADQRDGARRADVQLRGPGFQGYKLAVVGLGDPAALMFLGAGALPTPGRRSRCRFA